MSAFDLKRALLRTSGHLWFRSEGGPRGRDLGLVLYAEPITHTLLGEYVNGPFGICLHLLAQRTNIDAQILRVGRRAPEFAQGELMSQDFAGVEHQQTQ